MTLVLHGPSFDPTLPLITPEALAAKINTELARDVANVLDFGADPTGVADSSDAINAAAAQVSQASGPNPQHKSVYLPSGNYRVNSQINLTASQGLFGDTRGSSTLFVDDQFDPAADAVIMCTAQFRDPGPVLRDFGITFIQPQDQGLRANFRTLAAGGTSHPGGTGVKYPWAISATGGAFRVQVIRARITGAWDGITTNNNNMLYYLDDIEMSALHVGVSYGRGTAVLDFSHVIGFHYWSWDLGGSVFDVYNDGENIAFLIGNPGGLNMTGLNIFCARIVVDDDTGRGDGALHITNCMMDTDASTIEVLGIGMNHFFISNMYYSCGTVAVRPFITVSGPCNLHIENFYSHSSSNHPILSLSHDSANVTVSNVVTYFYPSNINWALVAYGILRILHGRLYLGGSRTVAAIAETTSGRLVIDDVNVMNLGGAASGPLLSMVTSNTESILGTITMASGSSWTISVPSTLSQTFLSPQVNIPGTLGVGGIFSGGLVQANNTIAIAAAPGSQKALIYLTSSHNTWAVMSIGAGDDFVVARWDNSNVFQGNPISISRSTGQVTIPTLVNNPANDFNSMQTGSLSFSAFSASAHYCTAYGFLALGSNLDSATNNTAFGSLAGFNVTSGSGNAFFGATSGYGSTGAVTGSFNTALGAITAYALTTGGSNTLIGYNVGNGLTTGSGNLHIAAGSNALAYVATESHTFRLGDHATNLMRATGINTATPAFFLDWLPSSTTYANDAAAATGGVSVGQLYRNGSVVQCRVT